MNMSSLQCKPVYLQAPAVQNLAALNEVSSILEAGGKNRAKCFREERESEILIFNFHLRNPTLYTNNMDYRGRGTMGISAFSVFFYLFILKIHVIREQEK